MKAQKFLREKNIPNSLLKIIEGDREEDMELVHTADLLEQYANFKAKEDAEKREIEYRRVLDMVADALVAIRKDDDVENAEYILQQIMLEPPKTGHKPKEKIEQKHQKICVSSKDDILNIIIHAMVLDEDDKLIDLDPYKLAKEIDMHHQVCCIGIGNAF